MEGSSKGLRKGAWTSDEDCLLRQCIDKYGEGKWHQVPLRAGLNRCRKSCRLRWLNYLKPSVKKGKFNSDEIDLLLRLHKLLGNRWSLIAGRLPDRTANDVKNYYNTKLSKTKTRMKKKNITSSLPTTEDQRAEVLKPQPTTEDQRAEVLKPQPRPFSVSNGLPNDNVIPSCFGLNNVNVCKNNITYEDNLWLESLRKERQEENAQTGLQADKETLMFDDFDQLWSLFDAETMEPK